MPGQRDNEGMVLQETFLALETNAEDFDLSLLKDSLAKTPWERMQANDDALNFGESLRAAMLKHHAKPKIALWPVPDPRHRCLDPRQRSHEPQSRQNYRAAFEKN
jgi:hypothetical protein